MITRDDIDDAEARHESDHALGSRGGIGRGYRYVNYPRLRRVDRWWVNPAELERRWYVDGVECETLEDAIVALNIAAILSRDEEAALARVPDEFTSYHAVWAEIAGAPVPRIIEPGTPEARAQDLLHALRDKGMIEFLPPPTAVPRLRRTAAGRDRLP